MSTNPFQSMVHDHMTGHNHSAPLLAYVRQQADRHTRRLPGAFFELGERNPEAVTSLGDRVFTRCDRVPLGRHPFKGRTPFAAISEDRIPDPVGHGVVFHHRPSILWDEVKADYAANVCRDPALQWDKAHFDALGPILERVAVREGAGRRALWRASDTGPHRARPPEEVARLLARRWAEAAVDPDTQRARPVEALDLEPMVVDALRLLGVAVSRSALARLLADALPAPLRYEPEAPVVPARALDRAALRETLRGFLAELDPEDRGLLLALVRGVRGDALLDRHPHLNSRSALSKRLKALSEACATVLARSAELAAPGAPALRPQDFMLEVVLTLQSLH
ncbi:MAG: hypothetical protein H6739_19335 [Alphaproteobacteria bacterium]|nr:hypothetical protein [Alphaproteobacteria bacterium]